jgi:hypothetical protein
MTTTQIDPQQAAQLGHQVINLVRGNEQLMLIVNAAGAEHRTPENLDNVDEAKAADLGDKVLDGVISAGAGN